MDAFTQLQNKFKRGKWTQVSLAEAVGAKQPTVSSWLGRKKRPGRDHALNLQAVLGIRAESWEHARVGEAETT